MRIPMRQERTVPVHLENLHCGQNLPFAFSPVGSPNVSIFFLPPLENLTLLKTVFSDTSCHTFVKHNWKG